MTGHARLVGAVGNVHASPNQRHRLFSGQRQRRALRHCRISRREIILKRHGHAAEQIVQRRNRVQRNFHVQLDFRTVQQPFNRPERILASFLAIHAVAVGKTNLHDARTRVVAKQAENVDRRHRVAIDLQLANGLVFVVQHQQQQEIRLAAVAVPLDFIR